MMHRVSPLVTTGWLSKVLAPSSPGIRILDCSWFMKADNRQPDQDYADKHIPGALFFDLNKICDQTSPYSNTIPHPWLFGDHASHLGITNDTHVIVYDNHPKFSVFSSPRVWWMFQIFGHQRVSVLEGGLPKWVHEGHPVTSEVMQVEKTDFDVNYQPQLLKKFEDIVKNLRTQSFQVMDARSSERFQGMSDEPRKDIKTGHIPYSKNVPFTSMFNSEERTFKSPAELKETFEGAGIDLNRPLASTCGSGITACIIALGARLSGKDDVSMFDGSWEEYSQRASPEQIATGAEGHAGG